MQERQLIKKIKELRQIKPNKDWVLFTKKEILEQGKEEQILSWLFTPFNRPALVVRPLIAGVLILAGVFVYLYLGALTPQLAQLPFLSDERAETEMMRASLGEIQVSLAEISLSLNNLKNSRNPSQALAVTGVVKATAKEGERVISGVKDSLPKGVYASLIDGFDEVYEKSDNLGEELLEFCINSLRQISLSEEDQVRLQEAEEDYNEIIIMNLYNKYFNEN